MLASAFKDLYTGDVFELDMATNWIKSQEEDSVYQDSYTVELEKVQVQTKSVWSSLVATWIFCKIKFKGMS